MSIERRIRNIREERSVSQEALAERLKVSRQTVSKWETGAAYPSDDNLAALSRVFGLPMDALFFRERHEESVSQSQLEGEVIDSLMIGETIPMLPLE